MRILLVTILAIDTSDVPLILRKNLKDLGCEVSVISPNEDNSILEEGLTFSGLRSSWLGLYYFSRRVLKRARRFRPDILFIYGSNFYLLPAFLRKIKDKIGCKIILWEGNIQFWRWFQAEAIQYYDYCFVADSYVEPILKGPARKSNVYFLAGGCDPDIHRNLPLSNIEIKRYGADVSFIGTGFPNRRKLFENLTSFNLRLWGKLWDRSSTLQPFFVNEPVYGSRKMKIYKASKISINIQNPVSQINGVSCRIFEILSCGGFPITENKKDLERFFKVGEEIIIYDNIKDLKQKIEYYLKHPNERKKIAARGRERALREHTYKQRMKKLLKIVGGS